MKVTYTQNRFEIDGVPVINPEVLASEMGLQYGLERPLKDGDSFPLPDNIIAEKVTQVLNIHNEWVESIYEFDVVGPAIKEVYRLKLKEPIVDTGSKETQEIFLSLVAWMLHEINITERQKKFFKSDGNREMVSRCDSSIITYKKVIIKIEELTRK